MIVMGVVLVGAVFMGAVRARWFCSGCSSSVTSRSRIRAWWRWRKLRRRGPFGGGPEPGPAKGIAIIEGEYEVVEADADAARRDSGTR